MFFSFKANKSKSRYFSMNNGTKVINRNVLTYNFWLTYVKQSKSCKVKVANQHSVTLLTLTEIEQNVHLKYFLLYICGSNYKYVEFA